MTVRLEAPAKVNLSLRVRGRRADGYHEVDTTLATIGVTDQIEVGLGEAGRAPGVRLSVDGDPAVPTDATNLAARAAAEVLALAGRTDASLELRLRKRVPAAAGLGGGSSDAAAAALGAAHALGARELDLAPLLGTIGSDCPFFLAAGETGLARCTGRGEEVHALPALPERAVLVVTPDVRAETGRVYAAWRAGDARGGEDPDWSALSIADLRAALVNDLEAAALRAVSGLAAWRELFDRLELGHARLAGSGSSFFALFAEGDEAEDAAARVREAAERVNMRPRLVRAVATFGRGVHVLEENRSG